MVLELGKCIQIQILTYTLPNLQLNVRISRFLCLWELYTGPRNNKLESTLEAK